MKNAARQSLRTKLAFFISSLIICMMVVVTYLSYRGQVESLQEYNEGRNKLIGSFVNIMAPDALLTHDHIALSDYIKEISQQPGISYAYLIDSKGDTISTVAVESSNDGRIEDKDPLRALKKLGLLKHVEKTEIPIKIDQQVIAKLVIGVNQDHFIKTTRRLFLSHLATAITATILILFFISIVINNQVLNQTDALIKGFSWINQGELDKQIEVLQHDELGLLTIYFNRMLRKLKRTTEQKNIALSELERMNKTLEEIVEKRTRELEWQRAVSIQASKMASVGEMASGMAHEINNPLAIINGHTNMLKNGIRTGVYSTEKVCESLEKISTGVERIASTIRGLQNFSGTTAGKNRMVTPLSVIVKDTLRICLERFKNSEIKIEYDLEELNYNIYCNQVEISQIILNLLLNSFEAVTESNERWVKIRAQKVDSRVVLSVIDSGPPIPKKIQEKMMEPFFTTRPIGKGAGLGLSISHGLAEAHNGKLYFDESASNTTFKLELGIC